MDFSKLEDIGKHFLEQFPAIKRSCKRVYQVVMYLMSNEKIKSEGNLIRVSPSDKFEYFFGYYDKSPWDVTDRYMICMKVHSAYKSVAPKESADILLLDTEKELCF